MQKGTDKFSVTLILVSRIFRNFAAGLINIVFPYIVLTVLNQGSFTLGLIYTAALISTALLGLAIGFATDASPKLTFVTALATLPISTLLLFVFSDSLLAAYVAAVVGGFSASGSLASGGVGGFIQPIQSTITAGITSRRDRTFYYGLLSFLTGVSSAAGALVAGLPSINDVMLLATITSSASVIPALFVRIRQGRSSRTEGNAKSGGDSPRGTDAANPSQEENTGDATHSHRRFGLKSANIIGKFGLTGMINGFATGLIFPFLIPFFITYYGLARSEMGEFAFISGLIGAFALLLGPRLEHELGFLKGVVVTRGATAVLSLIFPFVPLLPVSLAIYFILPPLRVVAFPVVQTAMTDMVPREELGRAFGINQGARIGVASLGTSFAGYEFDQSSYGVPFVAYAAVMAANLYLYVRFFSGYRDPMRRKRE
ncbi:MAG TPA: MFS transporter [Nitrososphaerales archaeon]|nr:MFS transporter [Nitrososphaerales archaeon]